MISPVPFVHVSFSAVSFSIAAPKIWNSVLPAPRVCTFPDSFQCYLKTCIFPGSLQIPLVPFFLRLGFGFCWPVCTFMHSSYILDGNGKVLDVAVSVVNAFQQTKCRKFYSCTSNGMKSVVTVTFKYEFVNSSLNNLLFKRKYGREHERPYAPVRLLTYSPTELVKYVVLFLFFHDIAQCPLQLQ